MITMAIDKAKNFRSNESTSRLNLGFSVCVNVPVLGFELGGTRLVDYSLMATVYLKQVALADSVIDCSSSIHA